MKLEEKILDIVENIVGCIVMLLEISLVLFIASIPVLVVLQSGIMNLEKFIP